MEERSIRRARRGRARQLAAAAFTALLAASAHAQTAARATPTFVDGMAQVVPAFADSAQWVHQELWVETNFDSDHDGKPDRVHVDVTRPRQTETEGLKVPVVYGSSPYYAGTARGQVNWNVQQELGDDPEPRGTMTSPAYQASRSRISNALVNDWVPRGFAVVHSEAPGTGRSQGCPTVGDDPERLPMKFVVDWLNGRAKGYTTPTGSDEVRATSWSTGKVGMIGTSYEGTLPLAAATTGVKGLEVVIPISPNTSYYHYYRSNGLVRSPGSYLGEDVDVLYDFIASGDSAGRANCDRLWKNGIFAGTAGQDRESGDYNDFWAKRDLLPYVKNIKAAVLLAHGLNDYNVVPEHSLRIYNEMKSLGLPVSIYLHQDGHGGPPPADMVNRWFSHYLYGVENGVEKDPPVWIVEDAASQEPRAMAAAAALASEAARGALDSTTAATGRGRGRGRGRVVTPPTPFASFPVPGSVPVVFHPAVGGNGISVLAFTRSNAGSDKLVDDVGMSGSADASADHSPNRLLYATPTFTDTVHISGTPRVTLRIASSKPAANLSVWLVMLPYDSTMVGSQSHAGLVTRGWADPQNYRSLTKGGNYDSNRAGEKLVPGKFYDLTFDLEPDDEFIPPGKRLAVMIMSSDREFTLWPRPGTELTVDLAHSSFSIPIVGGAGALHAAGMR
ncbi:MAG TPA: Xaa-Pro dipeptidyl-peptidase [Gemmatimonadaceae bacterium]|jgi:X-Pro dipeptidyl-peptidase|nr:Xaa-Pro dipeptidyl-peptidase [Gemmatimonadaceae bacterium]